jgi:hypothetical protein
VEHLLVRDRKIDPRKKAERFVAAGRTVGKVHGVEPA